MEHFLNCSLIVGLPFWQMYQHLLFTFNVFLRLIHIFTNITPVGKMTLKLFDVIRSQQPLNSCSAPLPKVTTYFCESIRQNRCGNLSTHFYRLGRKKISYQPLSNSVTFRSTV